MLEHFDQYGYLGIFVALLGSGMGVPIPEELPVITAGVMVGHEDTSLRWYIMMPVCVLGVVIGDGFLYGMGRLWGAWLLERAWVKRRLLSPEKRAEIEKNFHDRGIAVLLGARLLPGIRTPIFLMAGVLRVPFGRFLVADGLYAIPGVNILFWISYWLTDQVLEIFHALQAYRQIVVVAILSGVAGAIIQRYLLMRKVSTGEKPPAIINTPAEVISHAVEKAADVIGHVAHLGHHHHEKKAEDAKHPEPSANGLLGEAEKPKDPLPPGM